MQVFSEPKRDFNTIRSQGCQTWLGAQHNVPYAFSTWSLEGWEKERKPEAPKRAIADFDVMRSRPPWSSQHHPTPLDQFAVSLAASALFIDFFIVNLSSSLPFLFTYSTSFKLPPYFTQQYNVSVSTAPTVLLLTDDNRCQLRSTRGTFHLNAWTELKSSCTAAVTQPEGRPGMSGVSGISGLSFDSTLLSTLFSFCLILLLCMSYLFFCLLVHSPELFQKLLQIFLLKDRLFFGMAPVKQLGEVSKLVGCMCRML